MAVTNPSDLFIPEVCAEYASQRFVQSLEAWLKLMGGAGSPVEIEEMDSRGAFRVEGQYVQRPVFKRIGSTLVAVRDVTSNSSLTPVKLTGDNEKGVKLHRRIGPVDVSVDAAFLSRATPEQISSEIGMQAGQELALNLQNSMIAAIIGALDGVASTANTYNVWAAASRTNLSPSVINGGLNLMGDQREEFRKSASMLLRSESYNDLFADAYGRSYAGVGDKALKGDGTTNTFNMNPILVDNSLMTTADAGFDKYHTILMGAGACQVQLWGMRIYPMFQVLDQEQVVNRWRADADFAIGFHGKTWDSTNGGANPSDATIATSTNWDDVFTNRKEVRMIKLTHNYSGN